LVARNTKLNVVLSGPIADLPVTVEFKDLPALTAMYAPDIRTLSDERTLGITDPEQK
jgi:hypothetical protein